MSELSVCLNFEHCLGVVSGRRHFEILLNGRRTEKISHDVKKSDDCIGALSIDWGRGILNLRNEGLCSVKRIKWITQTTPLNLIHPYGSFPFLISNKPFLPVAACLFRRRRRVSSFLHICSRLYFLNARQTVAGVCSLV